MAGVQLAGSTSTAEMERIVERRNLIAYTGDRSGRGRAPIAVAEVKADLAFISAILEKQLLQEDNRRLRQEVERLKGAVRGSLGQQFDQFGAADLGTRVDELMAENELLRAERDNALSQVKDLTKQLNEVQDDLTGTRESLRRMMRTEKAP
ncbi:hypothetical protein AB0G55_20640 [Streptomyces toyocaensis]|nr:hypothetical protein [Streptomyces toyocaensis]